MQHLAHSRCSQHTVGAPSTQQGSPHTAGVTTHSRCQHTQQVFLYTVGAPTHSRCSQHTIGAPGTQQVFTTRSSSSHTEQVLPEHGRCSPHRQVFRAHGRCSQLMAGVLGTLKVLTAQLLQQVCCSRHTVGATQNQGSCQHRGHQSPSSACSLHVYREDWGPGDPGGCPVMTGPFSLYSDTGGSH